MMENPTIWKPGNWKPNPNPIIYKQKAQPKPTICKLETPKMQ